MKKLSILFLFFCGLSTAVNAFLPIDHQKGYVFTIKPRPPALPSIGCIGFDPTNNPANANENFAFVNFGINSVSNTGITFTWYFKFYDGTLLVLNGQNPVFDVDCATNPVMSFGLTVSNGVTSRNRYAPPSPANAATYSIPGFVQSGYTCFTHPECLNNIDGDY